MTLMLMKKNEWSILTSFSELKLLSKYAGELRFGPAFIHLKTEPKNTFGRNSSETGFTERKTEFICKNGILIRLKAGVHTKANNDLIYYDRIKE